jgi:signal peptidase I
LEPEVEQNNLSYQEELKKQEQSRADWITHIIEYAQVFLLAFIIYFVIDYAVLARVRVEEVSMRPTILPGDRALVSKLAYRFNEPERGDVVVCHSPTEQADYIKRVIGVPGDEVDVHNGIVMVNGMIVDEPYIAEDPRYSGNWIVPADALFVLGDNRNQSSDSHEWGYIGETSVIGKAFMIYWPPSEIKILQHTFQLSTE